MYELKILEIFLILNNNINKRMVYFKYKLIMKLNILQIICSINYVVTFPNDLFDELWETNQLKPQANNNLIESQPKIKVEPNEEQFDGKWQDESALKGIVKVEHEQHYGAVKVEGKDKIKHEFEWWDEESGEFKEQLADHVKEEDQDGQAPNNSDQKKIGDEDENWEENENNSAPLADDYDQNNSKKHLSDQNNSTDQDESVDGQQNESNKSEKIESDQQKRQILKQFDLIKRKCKKAKLKNISMNELDKKIANKFGVCSGTIYEWKRKFGFSVGKKKFSDETKIGILKKYAKIKGENPKMNDCGMLIC